MQLLPAGLVAAALLTLGAVAAPAAASAASGHEVFRFGDPAIAEASALVVDDGLYLTSNDSGDTGRVFAVDDTGSTVGVTHWSADPVDTEALAPAGHGFVWVGDIGDNLARRRSVSIARIPVGRGERTVHPTTYRLSYPDGPTDAETLLRNPATGRLYVAGKNVFVGVLYAVPEHLHASGTNRLRPIGRVLPFATDGSFFPDGRHLVVRSYSTAVVYAWPSLQPVGSFALPHQRQGEGIAVAPDGAVYVSSEGAHSAVQRVTLPPAIRAAVRQTGASEAPTPSPTDPGHGGAAPPADPAQVQPASRDAWPWVAGGLLGLVALLVLVRAVRPR